MNLAFLLREEVVPVSSTPSVLERVACSIVDVEVPAIGKVLARPWLDWLQAFLFDLGGQGSWELVGYSGLLVLDGVESD